MSTISTVFANRLYVALRSDAVATQAGLTPAVWGDLTTSHVFSEFVGYLGGRNRGRLPFIEFNLSQQTFHQDTVEGGTASMVVTLRAHCGGRDPEAASNTTSGMLAASLASIRDESVDNYFALGDDQIGDCQAGPWGFMREASFTCQQTYDRATYDVVDNHAVKVSSTGHLTATLTDLLTVTTLGDISIGFWMKFNGAQLQTYGNALEIWQSNQLYTARTYVQIFTGTAGAEGLPARNQISLDPGGGASHGAISPLSGVWTYVSLVRYFSGGVWNYECYINAVLEHTWTAPDGTWTVTGPDQLNLGYDGPGNGGTDSANHSYRCLRIWKERLTAAQLLAEKSARAPVYLTNLWRNWNLNGLGDYLDTVDGAAITPVGTVTDDGTGPLP